MKKEREKKKKLVRARYSFYMVRQPRGGAQLGRHEVEGNLRP
jgi:hypothetical protein